MVGNIIAILYNRYIKASRKESKLTIPSLAINYLIDAFSIYAAVYLSQILINNMIFGGALYLIVQVWLVYIRLYVRSRALLPKRIIAKGFMVFLLAVIFNAALVFVYPYIAKNKNSLVLIAYMLIILLQRLLAAYFIKHGPSHKKAAVIAVNACFTIAVYLFLSMYLDTGELFNIISAVAICNLLVSIRQIKDIGASEANDLIDEEGISSYRIYNKMVVNVFVAINLSILCYICYMFLMPESGWLDRLITVSLWFFGTLVLTALIQAFLRRKTITKYDKPSIFVLGALAWTAASVGVFYNIFNDIYIPYIFWIIGLSCMLAIIISLGEDIKDVIKLGLGHEPHDSYSLNTSVMVEWSLIISYFLILVMLTVSSFIVEGRLNELEAVIGIQGFFKSAALLLPAVFIVISLVYALIQPLDKQYAEKLERYFAQGQEKNRALKERLQDRLLKGYKRIGIRIIRVFLKPLIPCRVKGKENVDLTGGPVIFVCNHLEVYGPVITALHMPFYYRPWVINKMISRESIESHMQQGIEEIFMPLPKFIRKRLPKLAAPIVHYVIKAVDPIPVYTDNLKDVVKTIKISAQAMEYLDNILLFPENPAKADGRYPLEGVSGFFTGFTRIAKEYYNRTKQVTSFYPVYINKRKRTMTFGKGVAYNTQNNQREERDRIVTSLILSIRNLADE